MNQQNVPILHMLETFQKKHPLSFHVPGHKNGSIIPQAGAAYYKDILKIDMTELPGLDDLHAPEEAIAEAEQLATNYFRSDHTFFLVGGSTAGNLAMIFAACHQGDKVLVQRNSHKSIFHGLELAGAKPVFLTPAFDKSVERYTSPSEELLKNALHEHNDAKALILTYPDYFGKTAELKKIIALAHSYQIPVLVDEAHGVHFSLGDLFPVSTLALGADIVVHSAHKMAPAMTMASFIHIKSSFITKERLTYYLQMIQSSSPSYPLMASLDLSRAFLAGLTKEEKLQILDSAKEFKSLFTKSDDWQIIPSDDPLKITIQVASGRSAREVAGYFEALGVYPELVTERQILFIHGLAPFKEWELLKKVMKTVKEKLKNSRNHATIEEVTTFTKGMQEISLSYSEMQRLKRKQIPLNESVGLISAEAITPYPPGIPFILKGEIITVEHVKAIEQMLEHGVKIQQRNKGIYVFCIS